MSSSSSSYSSSPPASPNQTNNNKKYKNNAILNNSADSTSKNNNINGNSSNDDHLPSDNAVLTTSTSENTRVSSSESMTMPNCYQEDASSYSSNLFQAICSQNTTLDGTNGFAKQSEELESSYLTSVSKNPITLRKTESLKLDSVQSIRNRFNRMNSNNIGTLTR